MISAFNRNPNCSDAKLQSSARLQRIGGGLLLILFTGIARECVWIAWKQNNANGCEQVQVHIRLDSESVTKYCKGHHCQQKKIFRRSMKQRKWYIVLVFSTIGNSIRKQNPLSADPKGLFSVYVLWFLLELWLVGILEQLKWSLGSKKVWHG